MSGVALIEQTSIPLCVEAIHPAMQSVAFHSCSTRRLRLAQVVKYASDYRQPCCRLAIAPAVCQTGKLHCLDLVAHHKHAADRPLPVYLRVIAYAIIIISHGKRAIAPRIGHGLKFLKLMGCSIYQAVDIIRRIDNQWLSVIM